MNLPTPEEVEKLAARVWHTTALKDDAAVERYLKEFAALLRNPLIQTLLRLQEGGEGTPLTQGATAEAFNAMRYHSERMELCTRAIEAATIERCAVVAATPFVGEQDDITMAAKDRIAVAMRALPSMVTQSNAAKQSTPQLHKADATT